MVAVSLLQPSDAPPYKTAVKQLGLGRRYLRFFKFFPLLDGFWVLSQKQVENGVLHLLEMGKVGFGALYLLGQNVTIVSTAQLGVGEKGWMEEMLTRIVGCDGCLPC